MYGRACASIGQWALAVAPLLHEARTALALPRHLRPARQQPGGGEQQAIPQVGRVAEIKQAVDVA